MRINSIAFLSGLLFAVGLGISGMTQPQKVVGFLNVFGNWDPSLAFVMIGAIAVHMTAQRFIMKRKTPVFADRWSLPEATRISRPLCFGAFIFGIGWALAGYCPGPALTALASLNERPWIFVASMISGMAFFRLVDRGRMFSRVKDE